MAHIAARYETTPGKLLAAFVVSRILHLLKQAADLIFRAARFTGAVRRLQRQRQVAARYQRRKQRFKLPFYSNSRVGVGRVGYAANMPKLFRLFIVSSTVRICTYYLFDLLYHIF